MTFIEALGKELSERGFSRREMATGSGLPTGTVNSWFSARASEPSVESARRVSEWLGNSIEGLIDKHTPGKLQETSTIRRRLDAFLDQLGDTELRILLGTARVMVEERQADDFQSGSGS